MNVEVILSELSLKTRSDTKKKYKSESCFTHTFGSCPKSKSFFFTKSVSPQIVQARRRKPSAKERRKRVKNYTEASHIRFVHTQQGSMFLYFPFYFVRGLKIEHHQKNNKCCFRCFGSVCECIQKCFLYYEM